MEHIKHKVSPFRQAYLQWCSLRTVPFRTKFFVGYDLDGNTYWEFYNANNPLRPRRIVEYRENALNWVDYKMPPQWMQWLRFTRPHYPTLEELHDDKVRQELLKYRVQAAEERWKSIPLKEKNAAPQSAADVLQQYQTHQDQDDVASINLAPTGLQDMFKPPKSSADLAPKDREALKLRSTKPVETLEKEEDKYAQPPKPVVQANPSDAFEPGTWAHQKPIKRN